MYMTMQYDWVDPNQTRTPEEYPYSFDSFYVWRGNLQDSHTIYSDRMWQWDPEKAKKAFGSVGQRGSNLSPKQCKEIIYKYYGSEFECVGYALSCNQSSGYEIGIFFVKEISNES